MRKLTWLVSLLSLAQLALAESPSATPASSEAPKAASNAASVPAPSAAPSGEEAKLTGDAQKVWVYLGELFEASKLVNSNDAAQKKAARAKIDGSMDWDRVAQECLGKSNWTKASAPNRAKFKALLKEVILKTAYSRMDKFWDKTTYSLGKMDLKGSSAVVATKFNVMDAEPIMLEYYLTKKGKWSIFDVSFEDLRYSVNISEQIEQYLKESNFNSLLDKLKKRSAEIDSKA